MSTQAYHQRHKKIREGKLDPTISRQSWQRKPQTQIVPNKKAANRRTHCRKQVEDGGFVLRKYWRIDGANNMVIYAMIEV